MPDERLFSRSTPPHHRFFPTLTHYIIILFQSSPRFQRIFQALVSLDQRSSGQKQRQLQKVLYSSFKPYSCFNFSRAISSSFIQASFVSVQRDAHRQTTENRGSNWVKIFLDCQIRDFDNKNQCKQEDNFPYPTRQRLLLVRVAHSKQERKIHLVKYLKTNNTTRTFCSITSI